ncbi:plasmid partitioning protein RepB [Oceaniglobus ichthyenteri]|uniref:plasmid partitioning protein RepB n=1 Tax=Oceaniglobus ichthyenteri TaxID=2136177 RepID=UPI000D35DA0D|nr:plasmid partitioning protein RepB [Oceaniglobus ichthyenteri]
MSDSRKKRLSMLDGLASAGPAPTPGAMMPSNRALRSARTAVDGHHVWELDPGLIDDTRIADRLNRDDVDDLRDAIDANGQTVPILVRRNPDSPDRYLLIYGRRRLEAIRTSKTVTKVRALVAAMDDDAAVRAQLSENMARRDLSFIEKALFAQQLLDAGFGTQTQIAEVLTVTKSSVSMALAIVARVTPELVRAIGPAHGVGRPRWETLANQIESAATPMARLIEIASETHTDQAMHVIEHPDAPETDASVAAFDAVLAATTPPAPRKSNPDRTVVQRSLKSGGLSVGKLRKTDAGLRLDLASGPFADWLEQQADDVIADLHTRWQQQNKT